MKAVIANIFWTRWLAFFTHFVVRLLSCVWLFATLWTVAHQCSLFFTMSQGLLKLLSTEPMMPSKHLVLFHLLLHLPSILPSTRVFSNDLALCIRWPKYWSFRIFRVNFLYRIDWFDLLAVQGTLKSLIHHYSLKASILWHSAFFMVQLSHPYMIAGRTIALTIWTFCLAN